MFTHCVTCVTAIAARRSHGGVAFASSRLPEQDSENFYTIFASALDSTPVLVPYTVYDEPSQCAVTKSRVFRTRAPELRKFRGVLGRRSNSHAPSGIYASTVGTRNRTFFFVFDSEIEGDDSKATPIVRLKHR